jgi:glycosyltransferase involved in cell wall biosynthesis
LPVVKSLVIIPAYNEQETVGSVVDEISAHAPDFDVVVVDDGSTDQTWAVALSHGARVIRLPFNLGIGGAVQTGYRFAADNAYDIAVQVDADGQHDPRTIHTLLDVLNRREDIGMVVGSRFLDENADGFRSSAPRRVGIRLFGALLSRIVGSPVTDPTSGLRMVGRAGIELFARDYPHDYPEVEAVVMMHAHRLEAIEVPVVMRDRQGGQSSINATQSLYYMVKVTLAVLIGLARRHPVVEAGAASPVHAEHAL